MIFFKIIIFVWSGAPGHPGHPFFKSPLRFQFLRLLFKFRCLWCPGAPHSFPSPLLIFLKNTHFYYLFITIYLLLFIYYLLLFIYLLFIYLFIFDRERYYNINILEREKKKNLKKTI